MNIIELQEFNRLTTEEKIYYIDTVRNHPNWEHDKVMKKVKFIHETDKILIKNKI